LLHKKDEKEKPPEIEEITIKSAKGLTNIT
jgi:hypothetical protein